MKRTSLRNIIAKYGMPFWFRAHERFKIKDRVWVKAVSRNSHQLKVWVYYNDGSIEPMTYKIASINWNDFEYKTVLQKETSEL